MIKRLFYLLFAIAGLATAFASCSKDEEKDDKGTAPDNAVYQYEMRVAIEISQDLAKYYDIECMLSEGDKKEKVFLSETPCISGQDTFYVVEAKRVYDERPAQGFTLSLDLNLTRNDKTIVGKINSAGKELVYIGLNKLYFAGISKKGETGKYQKSNGDLRYMNGVITGKPSITAITTDKVEAFVEKKTQDNKYFVSCEWNFSE